MTRMNWGKSKKSKPFESTRRSDRLERDADRLLASKEREERRHHDYAGVEVERIYYRSIGCVMLNPQGKWQAYGRGGVLLGEFPTRLAAWQVADKCGLEIAGRLG